MTKTINREVTSVNIARDYSQMFVQSTFKGLCDDKNDVTVNPQSFSSVENVYVDDNGVLISRPPFKKMTDADDRYIVREWRFGQYVIRYYRWFVDASNKITQKPKEATRVIYTIKCVSHELVSDEDKGKWDNITWNETYDKTKLNTYPPVNCLQSENKIYIWIAGKQFVCLNTAGLYFEDAKKYVYIPITKTSINNIESDFESPNFLTGTFKKRYVQDALSDVDFSYLYGKKVQVRYKRDNEADAFLYDVNIATHSQKKLMVYPLVSIPINSKFDVVKNERATVYMRYVEARKTIEISYDGIFYTVLPLLDDTIRDVPQLSKDGQGVFVFGGSKLYHYSLVDNQTNTWTGVNYLDDNLLTVNDMTTLKPRGCFLNDKTYCYIITLKDAGRITTTCWYYCKWSTDTADFVRKRKFEIADHKPYFMSNHFKVQMLWNYTVKVSNSFLFGPTVVVIGDNVAHNIDGSRYDLGVVLVVEKCDTNDDNFKGLSVHKLYQNRVADTIINNVKIDGCDILVSFLDSSSDGALRFSCSYAVQGSLKKDNKSETKGIFGSFNSTLLATNTTPSYDKDNENTNLLDEAYFFKLSSDNTVLTENYLYVMLFETSGIYQEFPITNSPRPILNERDMVIMTSYNKMWTSQRRKDIIMYYDAIENENAFNYKVPEHISTLSEYFLSYDTEYNLLETSSYRYDIDKLDKEKTKERLLYFPLEREQRFSNSITNLHQLAEESLIVFTESEIYYITARSGTQPVEYYAAIKSKIPFGCHKGSEVITALDGQSIIFPTARGIAALTPQDFVATTERTVVYLTDNIQDEYNHFYNDIVMSTALQVTDDANLKRDGYYLPMIKIGTYRYWIVFHRYLDRKILIFDTRDNTWWILTTPYPIKQLSLTTRFRVIMEIDFSPLSITSEGGVVAAPERLPLLGVSYLLKDDETNIRYKQENFPVTEDEPLTNKDYFDDVIDGALNGVSKLVYENKFVDSRSYFEYATPTISWHITSQRLSFGAINNYKIVKGINVSAKGTKPLTVKFSTKAFRDFVHPEQFVVNEIKINDLRTYVKRMNLMHTVYFQYKIEHDENAPAQLKFNSLSLRYEIKERVR